MSELRDSVVVVQIERLARVMAPREPRVVLIVILDIVFSEE